MSAVATFPHYRRLVSWVVGLSLVGWSTCASGQVQIRDFTRPFVVLDTGGHTAPVRSVQFVDDGHIISAGMDKIIQTWSFGDGRPTLQSTIRPATWRGFGGVIYATAISPKPDSSGQRILAVAGYGAWSTGGNITLFHYPGNPAVPTGEVFKLLPTRERNTPKAPGHANTVMSLAFSPDGSILASAGNDGCVILWDVATWQQVARFEASKKPINVVAFRPDGKRLAAGGADGVMRLWDIERRVLINEKAADAAEGSKANSLDNSTNEILTIVFAWNGRALVIGREGGKLSAYIDDKLDDKLVGPKILQAPREAHGPIESLAVSHDGKTLAIATVAERMTSHSDRPRVDCLIEFRSLPGGAKLPRTILVNNLVYALAFSPDDQQLAVAGGDDQAVRLYSLVDEKRPPLILNGQGKSVWRVGFADDSRTIGLSHAQESAGKNVEYVGFGLKDQKLTPASEATVHRAIEDWNGWRVEPQTPYELKVIGPGNQSFPIRLDPVLDRRWWKYSFLPPAKGHPKAAVAVATDTRIVIHRLDDGIRSRVFAGHTAAIYDLAPSPDGMWLVSGSADQTARIWSLASCDTIPSLGATFRKRPDGKPEVLTVEERGFADAMGLKVGDVVEILAIDGKPRDSLDDLATVDRISPSPRIEMRVQRAGAQVEVGTTRRDSPRLSFFVGEDREWVVWTPEGYYETSVAGDRKYLGWHRNGANLALPTDHFPAETFEKELRRPAVISALINTDNQAQAFALVQNQNPDPAAIVAAQAPPVVTLTASAPRVPDAPIAAPPAGLTVRAQVAAGGRSPITEVRVLVDGLEVLPRTTVNPPADVADVSVKIPLHTGRQKVAVVAVNKDLKERVESVEVLAPIEAPRVPTLHVVTIGASGPFRSSKYPEIPFAADDAKDLRTFFAAPGGKPKFDRIGDEKPVFGEEASGKNLRQTFLALAETIKDPNDALVVVLESHMLVGAKERFVIATDTGDKPDTASNLTAEELSATLAKVAARGCKVLLLLDTSHPKAPAECREGLTDFVRDLSRKNVIAFVAANHGVGQRVEASAHGAFTQGVLDCFDARAISRPWVDPSKPMSLDDFQDAVVSRVKELTGRKQFAACYVPETLSSRMLIFEPNRPQNLADAK